MFPIIEFKQVNVCLEGTTCGKIRITKASEEAVAVAFLESFL